MPEEILARAKVNCFLEVTGKRPDGYHDIDSVFVAIDFADTVEADAAAPGELTLACDAPDLPTDARNLALRAALLLREHGGGTSREKGLALRLRKRIPFGAGLGGGSSDAAAVLRLANAWWDCGLSDAALLPLAAKLGSDVPFFLHGGACRCRGRGELIDPLPEFPKGIEFGLALPPFFSSTAESYRRIALPPPSAARSPDPFLAATARGDVRAMREEAFNRFEATVFAAQPELGRMHRELETLLGHSARMSGSGSALWFFAEKGWRNNGRLASWARANRVVLISAFAIL